MTHRDGFPRLSDGVQHGLRCPASPADPLLPGGSPARSLWVIISAPWYDASLQQGFANHPIAYAAGLNSMKIAARESQQVVFLHF